MKKLLLALCFATLALPGHSPAQILRVLQLNIWQEGTSVPGGVDKIAEVIIQSKADVVAFSEVRNYRGKDWHSKILAALKSRSPESAFYGRYVGGDVGLVSRIPITSTAAVFDEFRKDSGSVMAYRLSCLGCGSGPEGMHRRFGLSGRIIHEQM